MRKKVTIILALLLVLTLFLTACGKSEQSTSEEPEETQEETITNPAVAREGSEDTIIIGMGEAKGEFMPIYYSTAYDAHMIELMFDSLVINDEEGNYIPHVAERWDISEDGKTYTFYLRKDVKFWDGTPLTAHDVEFTYLAMADPNYDGRYYSMVSDIVGYEEYSQGDATNLSGIKVIDDYTISFTFKEELAINLSNCSMPIMPKHYYGFEKGDIETLKSKMLEPLGSGGYKFVEFEPGQYVQFEANPDYFLGSPKIKNMIVKFVTPDTQMAELETGSVDVLDSVTNTQENLETMERMGFVKLNSFLNNGYSFLGFNLKDPRLADKNVRQALTYGLDRQGFVDSFFQGHAIVCNVPLSPVSWAYTDGLEQKLNKYEYNPDKAIELLEEAGWKVGSDGIREKDGMKLDFILSIYPDAEWVGQLATVAKDNWGKLGINVQIESIDFNSLMDKVYEEQDMQIWGQAWSLTVDPDAYNVFHSSQSVAPGNNAGRFINKRNDELLELGRRTLDIEERKKVYEEWGLLVNEELPYIFIYQRETWNMVNERIKGFDCSPFVSWSYPQIYLNLEIVQ